MSELSVVLSDTLRILRENADRADDEPVWPEASWQAIQNAGVLKWCIPETNGGRGLDPLQPARGL